jgi:hypothetical protein
MIKIAGVQLRHEVLAAYLFYVKLRTYLPFVQAQRIHS